jgi:hypothetical protein
MEGFVCQLTEVEALYDEEHRENQESSSSSDNAIYSCIVRSESGVGVHRIGFYEATLSETFLSAFGENIKYGSARFILPLRYLDAAANRVTIPDEVDLSEIRFLESGEGRDLQDGQLEQVKKSANGIKTVLAVRVKAPDGDAPETVEEIAAAIFGTTSDSSLIPTASVVSQYASVSHGQLSLIPATGPGIVNGVAEITIDQPVKGARIQAELSSHLLEKTAEALGAPVDEIADRIIYCIPTGSLLQGRDTWTAYTYLFQHVSTACPSHPIAPRLYLTLVNVSLLTLRFGNAAKLLPTIALHETQRCCPRAGTFVRVPALRHEQRRLWRRD